MNCLRNKKFCFSDELIIIYETWSKFDYDRSQIDSILYRKCYRKISNDKWNNIIKKLLDYKQNEMIIHIDSLKN